MPLTSRAERTRISTVHDSPTFFAAWIGPITEGGFLGGVWSGGGGLPFSEFGELSPDNRQATTPTRSVRRRQAAAQNAHLRHGGGGGSSGGSCFVFSRSP